MPGVCSSICTISDSGAEANTSASMSPASMAITAGVCDWSRKLMSASGMLLASSSFLTRLGAPLPGGPMFSFQPANWVRLVKASVLSRRWAESSR